MMAGTWYLDGKVGLGTGGSNQDMPQVNPIDEFSLLQFDLTLKF